MPANQTFKILCTIKLNLTSLFYSAEQTVISFADMIKLKAYQGHRAVPGCC